MQCSLVHSYSNSTNSSSSGTIQVVIYNHFPLVAPKREETLLIRVPDDSLYGKVKFNKLQSKHRRGGQTERNTKTDRRTGDELIVDGQTRK